MISWEYFKIKRGIKVIDWIKSLGIKNYDQFSKALIALGVEPPPQDALEAHILDLLKKEKEKIQSKLVDQVKSIATESNQEDTEASLRPDIGHDDDLLESSESSTKQRRKKRAIKDIKTIEE